MLILYPHDAAKFFDKEVLVDCMSELYKTKVDARAYRLFFLLNQNTRIRVRTGCGLTDWEEAGDGLGQGSGGAAKVSALNLDRKLDSIFNGSKQMINYGGVRQQPYAFQDDAMVMVDKVTDLRVVVRDMDTVMNMMQVQPNKSKCGYLLLGPKKLVEEARKKLEEFPVMVGNWRVQELKKEKWLGDQISNMLAGSIMNTIQSRAPRIRRASYEIVSLLKDYRAQRVGGFSTALLLWESCALPSLLYNCSTWVGMGRKEEEALAECQFFFLRLVLDTGPGAPKHALRADLGVRSTLLRVWQQKILLVLHIRSLEDTSLAKMMYEEQVSNNWPGLAKETVELCKKLEIEDVNTTSKTKSAYAKELGRTCLAMEDAMMKTECVNMQKMNKISAEDWGLKEYVKSGSLWSVRKTWEARSFMLHVAGNYSHNRKYEPTDWQCQACTLQVREDQDHLGRCQGYADLRQGLDLSTDEDLVEFFRQVMARRERQGWD